MEGTGALLVQAVVLIPAVGAAVLALLPGYRLTARLNILASLLTLLAGSALNPPAA